MIRTKQKEARRTRRAQLDFARRLAMHSPLIDGRESRVIARLIKYDIETAEQIMSRQLVDWEPRNTYFNRLKTHLKS